MQRPLAFALGIAALALAGGRAASVSAGGAKSTPSCGCTTPSGHEIVVPTTVIPNLNLTVSTGGNGNGNGNSGGGGGGVGNGGGNGGGGGGSGGGGGGGSGGSSGSGGGSMSISANGASTTATGGSTTTITTSSGSAVTAATVSALSNAYASGGGGSNWSMEQSTPGLISSFHVDSEVPRGSDLVCHDAPRSIVIAVQAVCLDDKAVPHPASQVSPERDVPGGYQGEIYRCIAGARMQYTIGSFDGQPNFGRSQTVTCDKGMALVLGANGALACQLQKPARDCNERSLLRRYGAGLKVIKTAPATCAPPSREQNASTSFNMVLDGGVGGVVR